MKNILEQIQWPSTHMNSKGVLRWTSIHNEPPRAVTASAFQKNDCIELRVRATGMSDGDQAQLSYSRWEASEEGYKLVSREGQGLTKELNEADALKEFQDYIILTDARPQFQMMGILKNKIKPSV